MPLLRATGEAYSGGDTCRACKARKREETHLVLFRLGRKRGSRWRQPHELQDLKLDACLRGRRPSHFFRRARSSRAFRCSLSTAASSADFAATCFARVDVSPPALELDMLPRKTPGFTVISGFFGF